MNLNLIKISNENMDDLINSNAYFLPRIIIMNKIIALSKIREGARKDKRNRDVQGRSEFNFNLSLCSKVAANLARVTLSLVKSHPTDVVNILIYTLIGINRVACVMKIQLCSR